MSRCLSRDARQLDRSKVQKLCIKYIILFSVYVLEVNGTGECKHVLKDLYSIV